MAKEQLREVARNLAASDPTDTPEQQRNLMLLQVARRHFDRHAYPKGAEHLDGAILLMTYVTQQGGVGGAQVLEVVGRLIESAIEEVGEDTSTTAEEQHTATREPGRGLVLHGSGNAGQLVGDVMLGELMVRKHLILQSHVDEALRVQRMAGIHFGEALVRIGAATADQVAQALDYQDSYMNLVQGVAERRTDGRKLELPAEQDGPRTPLKLQGEDDSDGESSLRLISDVMLGDVMVRHEIISESQLSKGLQCQRGTGMRLGEALVNLGFCTWSDVKRGLERQKSMRRRVG